MATDVDVQFFSHLNGLVLSNNWGDMIRLLDACLANGLPLPSVTSASIDSQGDITLNLYADHKSLLFQTVELSGFEPAEINGKYRIKGTPTTTQLILKATHVGKTVTKIGTAKLASLGYDIVFRDSADVKRVYRAKNPRAEHPFIRVDETISDGTNSYASSYAKYAMVGLLENMTHIDDYEDATKLQLPLDTSDLKKNWKISGTGTTVVRGWSRWYWARETGVYLGSADSSTPPIGNRQFTLCGDADAFYFCRPYLSTENRKVISGCGVFNTALDNSVIPNWFLMACYNPINVSTNQDFSSSIEGGLPLTVGELNSRFLTTKYSILTRQSKSEISNPIVPNYSTGSNSFNGSQIAALEIPFFDGSSFLRGSLKHVLYSGNSKGAIHSTAVLGDSSMYICDSLMLDGAQIGGVYFYLGELE